MTENSWSLILESLMGLEQYQLDSRPPSCNNIYVKTIHYDVYGKPAEFRTHVETV